MTIVPTFIPTAFSPSDPRLTLLSKAGAIGGGTAPPVNVLRWASDNTAAKWPSDSQKIKITP